MFVFISAPPFEAGHEAAAAAAGVRLKQEPFFLLTLFAAPGLQPQMPTLTEVRELTSDGTSAELSWPSTAEVRYPAGCPLQAAAM